MIQKPHLQLNFNVGKESHLWLLDHHFKSHWLETLPSTQSWAKEQLSFSKKVGTGTTFDFASEVKFYLCDEQNQGRGRGLNHWHSPHKGSSFQGTLALPLIQTPPPHLTLIMGLLLARTVHQIWPELNISIKKPNDLYIKNQKVAGLLLEAISQGNQHFLVLGLGLNVFEAPQSIEHATCLQNHLSKPILLKEWHNFFDVWIQELTALWKENPTLILREDDIHQLLDYINQYPLLEKKLQKSDLLTVEES